MKHRYYAETNGSEYLVVVDDTPEGLKVTISEAGEPEPEVAAAGFCVVLAMGVVMSASFRREYRGGRWMPRRHKQERPAPARPG